jgi:hypothetical protein
MGHVRGDSKCTAGASAVWKGAPEGFKRRLEGGSKNPNPQKKGGKGKGGSTQRNAGKRRTEVDTSKLPCHNWSRGNGFCKYAEACRYSHSGPKGGSGKSITLTATLKKEKKSKKSKAALVITNQDDEKSRKSVCWESNSEDSDHLYELIRGVPTVIVSNDRPATITDFIPKRDLIEPRRNLIGSKI